MKVYYEENKDLFTKVSERQEVWSKFMDLERRAKDPARWVKLFHSVLFYQQLQLVPFNRLMNARGNSLLLEEKERNKVNKALPRLEQELHDLIARWEQEQGREFLVGGTNFAAFIANQVRLRRLLGISLTFQFFRKKNICRVSRPRSWPGRRLRRKTYCTRPDLVPSLPPQPSLKVSPSPPGHVSSSIKLVAALNNTKTPRKMPPTPKSTFGRSNSSRLVSKVVSHSRSELSLSY